MSFIEKDGDRHCYVARGTKFTVAEVPMFYSNISANRVGCFYLGVVAIPIWEVVIDCGSMDPCMQHGAAATLSTELQ